MLNVSFGNAASTLAFQSAMAGSSAVYPMVETAWSLSAAPGMPTFAANTPTSPTVEPPMRNGV